MHFNEDRGSRRRRGELQRQKLLEQAPAHSLGLEWRAMWRAEQTGKAKQARPNGSAEPKSKRAERVRDQSDAAAFAAAIARAEFGRFYWSEKGGGPAKTLKPPRKRNGAGT